MTEQRPATEAEDEPDQPQSHPGRPPIDITAVDLGGDMVMVTDRSGTIVDVNDAFVLATGYARKEAIGATPRLLKSGLQSDEVYRELWSTVLGGQVWKGELVDRHRDGSLRTYRVAITPIRGSDGQVTHMVSVQRDIAAQRSHPSGATGVGELHTNAEGRCNFVDTEAARLLDARPEDLYASGWETRIPSDDADAIHESIQAALSTGRRQRLDVRTHADRWLHLEIGLVTSQPVSGSSNAGDGRPRSGHPGGITGTSWLLEDITDQMEAHARLARRDALVTTLLTAIEHPVALVNADGTVMATNPAWSRGDVDLHPALGSSPGDDLPEGLRTLADRGSEQAERLARHVGDHLRGLPPTTRPLQDISLLPLPTEQGGLLIRVHVPSPPRRQDNGAEVTG